MLSEAYPLPEPVANLTGMTTSNGNLIPTPVVDKNGKATTVHKKAISPSGTSSIGNVSPSITSATASYVPSRTFIPTKKQTETRYCFVMLQSIDRRLPAGKKSHDERQSISFKATDVEIFNVMSVTRDNATAVVLLGEGIRTAEDARNFLYETEAEMLIDDRSELAQKALARRIDAETYFQFCGYNNPELWHAGTHLDRFLDGVEAYAYSPFQTWRNGPVVKDILAGKINLSDIKTIGFRNCKNFITRNDNHGTLHELASGSANYTAEQLRDVFKTCDGYYDTYSTANMMCQHHGGEWATSINWSIGAKARDTWRSSERTSADYLATEKAFITYADEFRKRTFRDIKDIKELFKANVSLDFAVEKSADPEEFTVDQLVAMDKGVPAPMTSGWL